MLKYLSNSPLIGSILQDWNGSPTYPGKQVQTGTWLTTLHWALRPHTPGHGSRQWLAKHAKFDIQSLFIKHSGLQPPE